MNQDFCIDHNPKPRQIQAARQLLGWSQEDLARHAAVAVSTVADFERKARNPIPATYYAMVDALIKGGVQFIIDGVRLT